MEKNSAIIWSSRNQTIFECLDILIRIKPSLNFTRTKKIEITSTHFFFISSPLLLSKLTFFPWPQARVLKWSTGTVFGKKAFPIVFFRGAFERIAANRHRLICSVQVSCHFKSAEIRTHGSSSWRSLFQLVEPHCQTELKKALKVWIWILCYMTETWRKSLPSRWQQ